MVVHEGQTTLQNRLLVPKQRMLADQTHQLEKVAVKFQTHLAEQLIQNPFEVARRQQDINQLWSLFLHPNQPFD
jgi:hypothetical protein